MFHKPHYIVHTFRWIWNKHHPITITLNDSHRTGITEIVLAIKNVEENIEDRQEMTIWDEKMYL